METLFHDRRDAGQQLAEGLAAAGIARSAIVIGLPRGGVPVATTIARALKLPLNAIGVRKISTPERPELAIGAIAEGGPPRLDRELIATLELRTEQVERATTKARVELAEAVAWLRAILPFPELTGATALLVDDGIATGATIAAAADAVRQAGAASVVIASPYCSATARLELRGVADTVLCLAAPYHFRSVSEAYEEFESTPWAEVERLLRATPPESD
jgi:putative phosphoribosyl transferase